MTTETTCSGFTLRLSLLMRLATCWMIYCLITEPVFCQDPLDQTGTEHYLNGLDQLERAEWTKAIESLAVAIQANDEQPDFYLARGVALTFAEKLTDAQKDLTRADRLRPNHKPSRMWLARVTAMQGGLFEDTNIFPAATNDPYETAVREMSRKYGDLAFQKKLNPDDFDARWQQDHDRARKQFSALAAQFVQRMKPSNPAVAESLKTRGIGRFWAGEFAAAKSDLINALQNDPQDLDVRFCLAGSQLALGSAAVARSEFTAILTKKHDWAAAYAGRSLALSALGNLVLAESDLATADQFDRAATTKFKQLIPHLPIDRNVEPDARPISDLLPQMHELAMREDSWSQLIQAANRTVRSVNATRNWADENYQRRLLKLRVAVGENPNHADRLADLGEFLYREGLVVLTEWVEPRNPPRTYRPQTDESQTQELVEAEQVLDSALKLDANHVRAMGLKAACLIHRNEFDAAEPMLRRALELDPANPLLLELLSQVLDRMAAVLAAQASDLRSTKSWSDWQYVYFRYPTAAEKALANQYYSQAQRLWVLADKQLSEAADRDSGTAQGFYRQATIALRADDPESARAALEQAVKLDPNYIEAWRRLIQVYGKLNMSDAMYQAQFDSANRLHTTAGPMLKMAWLKMNRTAWTSASRALEHAAAADPADPRVASYRGLIELERENPKEALAWFLVATALCDAQARLNGLELGNVKGSPLNPADVALLMQLSRWTGKLLVQSNRPDLATALLESRLSIHNRVAEGARYEPLPNSMLPEPQANEFEMPEAMNLETLTAWIRLTLGQACARLKRFDDARGHLQWVAEFETRKPSVLDVGMAIRLPQKIAQIELVKLALQQGDTQSARQLLMLVGRPRDLPADVAEELSKIQQQLRER